MSREWSSNGALAVGTEDYENMSSNLNNYSDITCDQKNISFDWHFPIIDLCEDGQWLLFENQISLNETCILEVCYIFKKKLLCEFQTEIFLQYPFIVQRLIKWLNENKETNLILECLNYLVEKLIKRHYEHTTGLCEIFENVNSSSDCNSQITITETNSETTSNDEISQWGIAKFCVSLMPTILKHISYNSDGAFSLFMSSMNLLSSIADSCNIKFYIELVFSNHTIKNILLNEPLSSLKFLVIVKKLLVLYSPNEQLKEVICDILKKPYWIHLYPELYHQLSVKLIYEELLEIQIIKMVENTYILTSGCNLDIKKYAQLFSTSLPIIWFHKKYNIIDQFIADTCKYAKITEAHNENEYSNILLNLLSFKLSDVVLYTYLALNKTLKKLLNNFNSESKKIDRLIEVLFCTNVLNEIVCFGCVNSNVQICQLASEIMGQLLKCKDTIKDNQWKCFLNNLAPVFPVLYCYANQLSTFGQIILNFFDPDQAEKFNISKLVLLQSIIIMLLSKDNKSRVEANNRITWYLQTSLNKIIDLPYDIFMIEFDELYEKVEEPIGVYTETDLDDMIDLISNERSSNQTIKCALYKISVMLEYKNLQQYFIQNEGMNIILNLLKLSKLFVNERGMLIALLKLILCFTKKNKFIDKHNLLANNFEIQLQLIAVLSDFYKITHVKQYILQIFFYCIFDQYLTYFGEIPTTVLDMIHTPIKINKYGSSNNNRDDTIMLYSKIKDNKNCMDVLTLTWNLNHFENIDLFLENGLTKNPDDQLFKEVFHNFRKASIKWSVKNLLIDLIAVKSHPVALAILGDLKRYLELTVHIEQFEVDEELLENGFKKFLILPPILLTDLQTLIVVLKLLNFVLKRRVFVKKLKWVADTLTKSISMHHNMVNNFENDESSNKLCNQFFIELYEVYWLCLKNYSHFSTPSLTKLLFGQLVYTKNEFVLLQVNMMCLTVLTENPKNVDTDLSKLYLSQLVSLKTILTNEKSLQRRYLIILNHILHYTILLPNIYDLWCMYDWETWTWSMIHSTDTLVRALVFQLSAGLAIIDIPVSQNLIQLALNYFCESNCLENCVVAEQATIFCSNIFCNPKFKSLCYQYIIKLDFNVFIQIIYMCSHCDFTKPGKKKFLTSPKLVANICCMLFNMITLTELDLHELDQNNQLVHELIICLKKYLTPVSIEKTNIMEMCGRICSVLTLFIPVSNYNFENLLTSLNVIYERIHIDLDHCITMVWRSVFKLTSVVIKCTNYNTFIITNYLISALSTSVTAKNNGLNIDALNVISAVSSQLSKKFANRVCKMLVTTLLSEWHQRLKRKMLLITLSNVFLEHPSVYETARRENLLSFVIAKLRIMQLQITKQSAQKLKTLQNDYLELVGFCCNIFHGCVQAREDASAELPDLIHKLWPVVVSNPKSDMLIYTIQMLTSFTSDCSSACSTMTMTSSTLGVDPKTKSTSYSLFHEIIALSCDFRLHGDVLNIALPLLANCCQAQECRVIIAKTKLLSNIISILDFKDKKRSVQIEQQCLDFLLTFTSFNEGQLHVLKVDYVLDTLVNLLNSSYKNNSIAVLRNLCFNATNRIILLSSDVFLSGIKSALEKGDLADDQYRDISLAVWSVACNNQKARLQLRHWGIDKYIGKSREFLTTYDDETLDVINRTYQILKS